MSDAREKAVTKTSGELAPGAFLTDPASAWRKAQSIQAR